MTRDGGDEALNAGFYYCTARVEASKQILQGTAIVQQSKREVARGD